MQNPSVIRARQRKAVAAPAQSVPWTFVLLVIVCACVVATGFFLAARQHFTSIDYGIKNSKLRDQLQNLEAEKRRLLLAREVALSPVAMRKAARGLGLRENVESADVAAVPVKSSPSTSKPAAHGTVEKAVATSKNTTAVVKTVMAAPTKTQDGGESRTRLVDSSKTKKDRSEVAALLKLR